MNEAMLEKSLELHIEHANQYLLVFSDRQVLNSVLDQMLQFCLGITPSGGRLNLSAELEHKDGSPDYALLQWICSVDLSQIVELSKVFDQYPTDSSGLAEKNSGVENLFYVRSLVSALGGRIWVDVEQGEKTIFSLILPVIQSTLHQHTGELDLDV